MTSKCGKNKKVAHEAIAECVTDVMLCYVGCGLWGIGEGGIRIVILGLHDIKHDVKDDCGYCHKYNE